MFILFGGVDFTGACAAAVPRDATVPARGRLRVGVGGCLKVLVTRVDGEVCEAGAGILPRWMLFDTELDTAEAVEAGGLGSWRADEVDAPGDDFEVVRAALLPDVAGVLADATGLRTGDLRVVLKVLGALAAGARGETRAGVKADVLLGRAPAGFAGDFLCVATGGVCVEGRAGLEALDRGVPVGGVRVEGRAGLAAAELGVGGVRAEGRPGFGVVDPGVPAGGVREEDWTGLGTVETGLPVGGVRGEDGTAWAADVVGGVVFVGVAFRADKEAVVGRDDRSVKELRVLFCDDTVLLALAATGRFAGVFMGDGFVLAGFVCFEGGARTISGLTGSLRSVLMGFSTSLFVVLVSLFVCCTPVSTSMASKGAPLLLFGFPELEGGGSRLLSSTSPT